VTVPAIALVGGVQLLVALAQFTLFTYISPFLTEHAGIPPQFVSVLLLVFGVAGALGLLVVGITADRWPRGSLLVALVAFAVALLALGLAPAGFPVTVVALGIWGLAVGALPPLLLARTLRVASDRMRSIASAVAVVAFNLGIGTGAAIGGLLVDGPGVASAALAAGAAAVLAFLLAVVSMRRDAVSPVR
jgi:predicted MFS family arabinose efflux permease